MGEVGRVEMGRVVAWKLKWVGERNVLKRNGRKRGMLVCCSEGVMQGRKVKRNIEG